MDIQTNLKLSYIEDKLASKGIIQKYDNIIDDENIQDTFTISATPPVNGQALVYNDGIYEPQNIGVSTPLSNTGADGATILKGTTEIKTIDNETGSLLTIINGINKISLGLQVNTTPNILLIGYTPPATLKEPVIIGLNNTHFNTTGTTLELNPLGTALINNGAITPAKLSNIGNSKFSATNAFGQYIALSYNNTPLSLYNNNLGVRYTRTITNNNLPITTLNFTSSRTIIIDSSTSFNHSYSINTSSFTDVNTYGNNETFKFQLLINNINAFDSPLFSFSHVQSGTSTRLGIPGDNCWLSNSQSIPPLKSRLYKFDYINNSGGMIYLINTDIIELTT
jgi:hypothetical protein